MTNLGPLRDTLTEAELGAILAGLYLVETMLTHGAIGPQGIEMATEILSDGQSYEPLTASQVDALSVRFNS